MLGLYPLCSARVLWAVSDRLRHQVAFQQGKVTRQSLLIAPDSGVETWTQVSSLPDILLLLEYGG